jgi:hypothetical protein
VVKPEALHGAKYANQEVPRRDETTGWHPSPDIDASSRANLPFQAPIAPHRLLPPFRFRGPVARALL